MNITTLANVYDTVYTLKDNKVVEPIVNSIKLEVHIKDRDLQSTKLYIEYRTTLGNFPESEVFLTKQALLESL